MTWRINYYAAKKCKKMRTIFGGMVLVGLMLALGACASKEEEPIHGNFEDVQIESES